MIPGIGNQHAAFAISEETAGLIEPCRASRSIVAGISGRTGGPCDHRDRTADGEAANAMRRRLRDIDIVVSVDRDSPGRTNLRRESRNAVRGGESTTRYGADDAVRCYSPDARGERIKNVEAAGGICGQVRRGNLRTNCQLPCE
jgi:hypothetical protein